jgi:hypothetical protein
VVFECIWKSKDMFIFMFKKCFLKKLICFYFFRNSNYIYIYIYIYKIRDKLNFYLF